MSTRYSIGIVLFDNFKLLNVFGPLEMFGMDSKNFDLFMVGEMIGPVASRQSPNLTQTYLN
jgi:hypothetical protein